MAFSEKQKEYFKKATKRWNIKTGATRSGKTYMDYFVIPKRIRATTGNGLIVILGNTQATVERNILDPMRKIWGDELVGTVKNDNKIELFGRTAYVLGADKKNAVTKLQGSGIEYAYGDEVTTWAEPVFQMLKSRLDKPNSVFDGTCNPDAPSHWLLNFLESDANIYHQHYTIDDNPFLTPFFVEQLKKEYKGVYYQRYILGQWARAEGVIYDMFEEKIHIFKEPISNCEEYYVSVDYGTQNATVFLLWGKIGKHWYCLDEYYHSGRESLKQKTDSEYADDLIKFAGDKIRQAIVIIDPSAASFKAELRKRGINHRDANNDVLNGIRLTQSLLGNEIIKFSPLCKNTIKEFKSYSWDEKVNEDRPIKENDHAMDAVRYFCYTILRRKYRS